MINVRLLLPKMNLIRRKHHVTWIVFCCCICVDHVASTPSWHQKKALHKPKTLDKPSLRKIAQQLDDVQTDTFKTELLAPFLQVRVSDTAGNRNVQKHIRSQMKALGWQVTDDKFTDKTPYGRKTFTNIIAIQNPVATRQFTLACHFDSKYFEDIEFIGAIDSAVSCAMMIDLARQLNPYLSSPQTSASDISLQMIFFDGEEAFKDWSDSDSLYGARHLASVMDETMVQVQRETIVSQLDTIDVLILLDLIGTSETSFKKIFTKTSSLYDRCHDIEKRLRDAGYLDTDKPIFTSASLNLIGTSGGIQDDHIPFLKKGVPVLHLISFSEHGTFPKVWHTEHDNESALDYPRIDDLTKILRVLIVEYLHLDID